MVSHVLVTGGCGFISKSLTLALLQDGVKVRLFDNYSVGSKSDIEAFLNTRLSSQQKTDLPSLLEFVEGDIRNADDLDKACKGISGIVHLAANTGVGPSVEQPVFDCEQNVLGTLNVLEAARHNGIKRFVFASSGAPAGEVEPPIHEEIVPKPVSPYGASKLAGEGYCSAYYRTFEIDTVALRFGNVYGPGSGHKSSVIAKFINRALDQLPLEIYGDGSQTRDFIYIDDLVAAIKQGLSVEGIGGEVFQVATSAETTVREVTEMIVKALENKGVAVPDVVFSEPRLGDVMRNFSDTSKAKSKLNWEAQQSLYTGIEKTLEDMLVVRGQS